jgi:hypothetical protein
MTFMVLLCLYPIAVLRWIDGLDAFFEKRYQCQVDRYLHELHERISAMKVHLAQSDLDPLTRTRLQQMCDDYERDLRLEVLNSEDE